MSEKALQTVEKLDSKIIEQLLLKGDLGPLNPSQRLSYYQNLCHSLGLNPLTKPFEYLNLQGKTVLYATKACAEQLRLRDGISIEEVKVESTDEYVRVTAKARNREGRTDVAFAVVSIIGLKGMDRANAEMRCDTKAKRRVTLSIAGLGMLDESEVETIKDAKPVRAEDIYDGTAEPTEYTIPFGIFKDHTIRDAIEKDGEPRFKSYMKWLTEKAEKKGVEIDGVVKEFFDQAHAYFENKVLEDQFKNMVERE